MQTPLEILRRSGSMHPRHAEGNISNPRLQLMSPIDMKRSN